MIGYIYVVFAEAEARRKQEEYFQNSIKNLPFEVRSDLIKKREETQKEYRKERTEERRHRELCSAIRSTGFW